MRTERPVRVCVIRQQVSWSPRVAREVRTLAVAGYETDLICLRGPGEPARERRGPVTIWRLAVPGGDAGGFVHYLFSYGWFFLSAAALVSMLHLRRRYRLVQVNTLPDVLVFAAALPRLLGARVLLDLQECMPEFFATKFGAGARHPMVRLIAALEQRSIRFADHVITPTAQLRETFIARGADPKKIDVVMDGSDEAVFRRPAAAYPDPARFTLISHGTIERRYGLDTAIEAVALLRADIPGLELKIYGTGSDLGRLRRLAAERGVADRVRFSDGFVPTDELVRAIAATDVGIVAIKRDVFRDLTLTCKMFDFIAMGVPMAVARTRSVAETFPPGCFESFESGDPADLARAIRRLHADPAYRTGLAARATAVAEPFRWVHQGQRYVRVVDGLVGVWRAAAARPRPMHTHR